jgi:L-2-hydroxycarboxylate dehydrogenase (NAD+)
MRGSGTKMHSQSEHLRFKAQDLEGFCRAVFMACGLNREQATQSAEVMVAADVRGIPSHGIGRLWRYVNGLKSGLMLVDATPAGTGVQFRLNRHTLPW